THVASCLALDSASSTPELDPIYHDSVAVSKPRPVAVLRRATCIRCPTPYECRPRRIENEVAAGRCWRSRFAPDPTPPRGPALVRRGIRLVRRAPQDQGAPHLRPLDLRHQQGADRDPEIRIRRRA